MCILFRTVGEADARRLLNEYRPRPGLQGQGRPSAHLHSRELGFLHSLCRRPPLTGVSRALSAAVAAERARESCDTGAVKALAGGHKTLNLLAGNMARTPGDRLCVPALCLVHAEAAEESVSRRVLAFSSVAVDSLDTMIRDGYGSADTCHALYCALPRPEFTGMSILLTDNEDAYPPGMLGFH